MRFEGAQPDGGEIAAIAAALAALDEPAATVNDAPSRWASAARSYEDAWDELRCLRRF